MIGAGLGSGGGGGNPAEVVQISSGASEVLQTPTGRQERVGALYLGHLDVPLPGGGGVPGADEGVDGVLSRASEHGA